jgi:hypothetical protein
LRLEGVTWLASLYPQNLALTSLASGGRSVGIVRSRTQATEFSFSLVHVCPKFRNYSLINIMFVADLKLKWRKILEISLQKSAER